MKELEEGSEQVEILLEDQRLCSAVREELYHGCVGAAVEFAEQISSFSLRADMFRSIKEHIKEQE